MTTRTAAPFVVAAIAVLALGGCHRHHRKAKAETGTAEATVKTTAPENVVSSSDLQQQAQSAATAASTPVGGSKPNATGAAH